ncbi:multiheme c-type cytochrome [Paraliomyxa miuraensis]|uniref:multiheme c-type cytochrome n=1 Tax=Paraliomyxa miuraensis TaxID=376150 RepID=UPI00224E693E|nr:multiheme c-type cytochrome [Paraliomyxa miuraensis]MCX4247383.1 cytochrome c family protein [Paraliomyxa miuraensis]
MSRGSAMARTLGWTGVVLGSLLLAGHAGHAGHASHASHASSRRTRPTAMPGPARDAPSSLRVDQNRECVECHVEVAAQWQGSLHQQAFVDPDVAVALAREPRAFCRGCHAPEGDPSSPPPREVAAIGVACVTCHVPPDATLPVGAVLAAPSARPAAASPHAIVRREAFATNAACAACHEFPSELLPGLMMQTTLTEHRASAFADEPCQSCHMPLGSDGRRTHGFEASRDPAMLRAAVHVRAQRMGDGAWLELAPGAIGHAFPTGDPFRRLSIELGHEEDGEWVVDDERQLTRRIGRHRSRLRQLADDRPGASPEPTRVVLRAPGLEAVALGWRVAYERLDMDYPDDPSPRIFDRVIVAEGWLAPL